MSQKNVKEFLNSKDAYELIEASQRSYPTVKLYQRTGDVPPKILQRIATFYKTTPQIIGRGDAMPAPVNMEPAEDTIEALRQALIVKDNHIENLTKRNESLDRALKVQYNEVNKLKAKHNRIINYVDSLK